MYVEANNEVDDAVDADPILTTCADPKLTRGFC